MRGIGNVEHIGKGRGERGTSRRNMMRKTVREAALVAGRSTGEPHPIVKGRRPGGAAGGGELTRSAPCRCCPQRR